MSCKKFPLNKMIKETNKNEALVVISKKGNSRQEVMGKSQYLMIEGDTHNVCDESLRAK